MDGQLLNCETRSLQEDQPLTEALIKGKTMQRSLAKRELNEII